MICIYAIINISDDNHYVGQTENEVIRWREHRKSLRAFRHHSIYLQRAWSKYGENNFIFLVLEKCNTEELNVKEQFWIDILNPVYNMSPTAGSQRGYKHTDEARKNMSDAHKGKHHTDKTKIKMSLSKKGNKFAAGVKHTSERIEARALLHRGKPKSEDHKAKIAAGNKGKSVSMETRAKQSLAAIKRHQSNPVSQETREKLSQAALRQWNGT